MAALTGTGRGGCRAAASRIPVHAIQAAGAVGIGGGKAVAVLDDHRQLHRVRGLGQGLRNGGQVFHPAVGLQSAGGGDDDRRGGRRGCGRQVRWRQIRRRPPSGRRRAGRWPAWRWRPRGSSACRSGPGPPCRRPGRGALRRSGPPRSAAPRRCRCAAVPSMAESWIRAGCVAAAGRHVPVQGVVAGVQLAVGKPAVQRCTAASSGLLRRGDPVHQLRRLRARTPRDRRGCAGIRPGS